MSNTVYIYSLNKKLTEKEIKKELRKLGVKPFSNLNQMKKQLESALQCLEIV